MTNRGILAVAILFLAATLVSAAPINLWFEKGNAAYEAQSYDSAVTWYGKIIQAGTVNPAVYYNLGNAYFRLNKTGLAILYYEKARMLAPDDPEILANIRFANSTIIDRMPDPERGFGETILWRMHNLLSLNAQLWLLFGLLMVLAGLVSALLFAGAQLRLWLIYLATLGILLTGMVGTSVGFKIHARERAASAIVLRKSIDARNEPNGNKVLFTAHEGTKFRIRKQMADWYLVSLPNGVSGWVQKSAVGKI